MNEPQETIYIADWEIHPETLRVSRGDDCVKLEPKVMQVLLYLAEKAGQVVSRQELEEHVWRNQIVGYDAISRTIINIRKALCGKSTPLATAGRPVHTRSLLLADLTPEQSVRLQQMGLGPHRKMGCGIFIPHKGIDAVKKSAGD